MTTQTDLQALKPEDYQAALDAWKNRAGNAYHQLEDWAAKYYDIILSALTRAAQPKPNHAELAGYVSGWEQRIKDFGHKDLIPMSKKCLAALLQAARSQLSGQPPVDAQELLEVLKRIRDEKAPSYHDCLDDGLSECAWGAMFKVIAKYKSQSLGG